MSGQQIALKVALRRLAGQYWGPADDDFS